MLYGPVTLISMPPSQWVANAHTTPYYCFFTHHILGDMFAVGITTLKGKVQQNATMLSLSFAHEEIDREALITRAQEYVTPHQLQEAPTETEKESLRQGAMGGQTTAIIITRTNLAYPMSHATLSIPFGTTRTYKEIAEQLKMPGAARAVGTALKNNQLVYIVPCHRVVRSDGSHGEYRWGAALKDRLLAWEAEQLELVINPQNPSEKQSPHD